jgi:hypothetical protein
MVLNVRLADCYVVTKPRTLLRFLPFQDTAYQEDSQLYAFLTCSRNESQQYILDSRLRCEAGKLGLRFVWHPTFFLYIYSSDEPPKFVSFKKPASGCYSEPYNLVHIFRIHFIPRLSSAFPLRFSRYIFFHTTYYISNLQFPFKYLNLTWLGYKTGLG